MSFCVRLIENVFPERQLMGCNSGSITRRVQVKKQPACCKPGRTKDVRFSGVTGIVRSCLFCGKAICYKLQKKMKNPNDCTVLSKEECKTKNRKILN